MTNSMNDHTSLDTNGLSADETKDVALYERGAAPTIISPQEMFNDNVLEEHRLGIPDQLPQSGWEPHQVNKLILYIPNGELEGETEHFVEWDGSLSGVFYVASEHLPLAVELATMLRSIGHDVQLVRVREDEEEMVSPPFFLIDESSLGALANALS
jgi:intein/homing endonuclease